MNSACGIVSRPRTCFHLDIRGVRQDEISNAVDESHFVPGSRNQPISNRDVRPFPIEGGAAILANAASED